MSSFRSAPLWIATTLVVIACYSQPLASLVHRWSSDADYSHGFLIPFVSGYFLWQRRALLEANPSPSVVMAAIAFLLGLAIRLAAIVFQYPLLEPVSLLPSLAGIAFLVGGWNYFKWSWPSISFLAFAIPLPGAIAGRMAGPLQRIATEGSTYLIQTVGIPAAASGNVILLSSGQIGVVEACNGLRMLVAFLAIAFAITLSLRIPLWERGLILLSGVVVAIVCNIIRITATSIVHETISPQLADKIFHDFAGWLMMPIATGILMLEILILGAIFPLNQVADGPVIATRASPSGSR